MKFNIFLTIQGPAKTIEAPNKSNPVEAENFSEILSRLATDFPEFGFELKIIGIRIEDVSS